MRRVFVVSALSLCLLTLRGQVGITGLSSNGTLSWSNCLAGALFAAPPIYAIERANSPTGAWQTVALVTNTQSFQWGELLQPTFPATFLRIGWLNATSAWPVGIYELTARNQSGSLAFTGRIEVASVGQGEARGTWELHPPPFLDRDHGFFSGALGPTSTYLVLQPAQCCTSAYISLGGQYTGAGFSGTWFFCGIVCNPAGTYVARRICP